MKCEHVCLKYDVPINNCYALQSCTYVTYANMAFSSRLNPMHILSKLNYAFFLPSIFIGPDHTKIQVPPSRNVPGSLSPITLSIGKDVSLHLFSMCHSRNTHLLACSKSYVCYCQYSTWIVSTHINVVGSTLEIPPLLFLWEFCLTTFMVHLC